MHTEIVQSSLKHFPIFVGPQKKHPHLTLPADHLICGTHLHDEVEFIRVEKGLLKLIAAGSEYFLDTGDMVFINRRVPHETRVAQKGQFSHSFIQFIPDLVNDSTYSHSTSYLYQFVNSMDIHIFKTDENDTHELDVYFSNIQNEYKNKGESYETYIYANLLLILGCLYRNHILNDPNSVFDKHEIKKIIPLLRYVNENYAENITLEDASTLLNLNRDYFCRLFKRITTMTFTDYLNFVRICHSEKLLTFSDKSIAEVSLDTGFASVSYFNRVFKKLKYVTPTEYRRSKFLQKN